MGDAAPIEHTQSAMSPSRLHRLLLWCAATDRTFERASIAGEPALIGKCIRCGRKLALALDGRPLSQATLEHVIPRTHGGTDELGNLAIACARCNAQKGYRQDFKPAADPGLQHLIAVLQQRRMERQRRPLPGLLLPELPEAVAGTRRKASSRRRRARR
jgi:hypothetical protein